MGDRRISIPRLLEVRAHSLEALASLLRECDFDLTKVCVGGGAGPSIPFAERAAAGLRAGGVTMVDCYGLDGTLAGAARLAAQIIEDEITLAVAVGGGRVIDTVKLAAARSGIEFVSCPTTIAHDGISSPVASLLPRDSGRRSFAAAMPAGIVVDIEVIASAPARTVRAGLGDLMSNLTAILDWQLAHRRGKDRYDAFAAMIAENAARSLLDLESLDDDVVHEELAKALLLSGLAMTAAGTSRPCSGSEHLISHSLDALRGDGGFGLHGEQVALGTLVAASAHGSPLLGQLRSLYERVGLPTSPDALGLDETTLIDVLAAAPATRPDRYTVLSEYDGSRERLEELARAAFSS